MSPVEKPVTKRTGGDAHGLRRRQMRRRSACSTMPALYQRRLPTGIALAPLAPWERPVIAVISNKSRYAPRDQWRKLTATEASAAATTTVTAIAATATTAAIPNHLGETGINVLLGLLENTNEVASLLCIWKSVSEERAGRLGRAEMQLTVSGEERNGCAVSAGTARSADTMDVILRVVGVVIVEHMSNIAHILKQGNG